MEEQRWRRRLGLPFPASPLNIVKMDAKKFVRAKINPKDNIKTPMEKETTKKPGSNVANRLVRHWKIPPATGVFKFFVERDLKFRRAEVQLKEGGGRSSKDTRGKKRKRSQMKEDSTKMSQGKRKIKDRKEKEKEKETENEEKEDNIFKMCFDHNARGRWMDSLKEGSRLDARLETGFFHKAVVKKRIGNAIYVHFASLEDEVDRWVYLDDNKHSAKVGPLGTYTGGPRLEASIIDNFDSFTKVDVYLDGSWMTGDVAAIDGRQIEVRLSNHDCCTVWFHLDRPDETAAYRTRSSKDTQELFRWFLLMKEETLAKSLYEDQKLNRGQPFDLEECEAKPHYSLTARGDWFCVMQHTPLNAAVLGGHVGLVTWLLELGADINSSTALLTPLMLATYKDDPRMVHYLIKRGADLYRTSSTNEYHKGFVELLGILHSQSCHQLIIAAHETQFTAEILEGKFDDGKNATDLAKRLRFARQLPFLLSLMEKCQEKIAQQPLLDKAINRRACFEDLFTLLVRKAMGRPVPVEPEALARAMTNNFPGIINERLEGNGETMLMRMLCGGSEELVKLLIECGASVNLKDNRGIPTLFYGCTGGLPLLHLIEPLIPVSVYGQQSIQGLEALSYAIDGTRGDRDELLTHLLSKKEQGINWEGLWRPDGTSLLWTACKDGRWDIAETLLDAGYTPDPSPHCPLLPTAPSHPLHWAIVRKMNGAVSKMVPVCKDLDFRAEKTDMPSLIHACCRGGNFYAAHLLLDHNADPFLHMPDNTKPLNLALINARKCYVDMILRNIREGKKGETEKEGMTPLMQAAYDDDLVKCRQILENSDENCRQTPQQQEEEVMRPSRIHWLSALHFAAARDSASVTPYLLSLCPEGWAMVGPAGFTPFLLACLCGSTHFISYLLQSFSAGDEALHDSTSLAAVVMKMTKQLEHKVKYEKALRQHTLSRMGALSLAIYSGNVEAVEALLKNSPEEGKLRELLIEPTPFRFVELSIPGKLMPFDLLGTLAVARTDWTTERLVVAQLRGEGGGGEGDVVSNVESECEVLVEKMREMVYKYLPSMVPKTPPPGEKKKKRKKGVPGRATRRLHKMDIDD